MQHATLGETLWYPLNTLGTSLVEEVNHSPMTNTHQVPDAKLHCYILSCL